MKEKDADIDIHEKVRVAGILKREFDFNMLYDEVIFIDKKDYKLVKGPDIKSKEDGFRRFFIHNPDGWVRSKEVAIEIDGTFHTESPKGIKQTNERNEHYDKAKLKYIWLTKKEVLECDEDTLANRIAVQLAKEFAKK